MKIYTAVTVVIMCLSLAACNSNDNKNEKAYDTGGNNVSDYDTADNGTADNGTIDWENDPTIGKIQPGCYKRIGITKKGETYEEMLELQDIENKGYLVVYDDGTATFELDGEKTEYVYDKYNLYFVEDAERSNGIPYFYIGGRLVVDDGSTVTQYLKLSDEELESVSENAYE